MTFRLPARNHPGAMEGSRTPAPSRASVFRRFLVRVTPAERLAADGRDKEEAAGGGGGDAAEVGSVALDRMVLSFMEDAAAVERPPRGGCNCFNGQQDASDDEDFDFLPSSCSTPAAAPAPAGGTLELLKGLVQCASAAERTLLADASGIAERFGGGRKKAEVRRAVAAGLRSLGYDAAVCCSRWDGKSHPAAGEHEYIDAVVVVDADDGRPGAATTMRLVVEVDFRSEFEVARPTKAYRAALQALPPLFVGSPDRLGRVVAVVAEAARQSLRKRGLHFPPWRRPEYMRAKWLAPHSRAACSREDHPPSLPPPVVPATTKFPGEFDPRQSDDDTTTKSGDRAGDDGEDERITLVVSPSPSPWSPAVVDLEDASKQQSPDAKKGKPVTGLASALR